MIAETEIRIIPELIQNAVALKSMVSQKLSINIEDLKAIQILKKSIDARGKTVYFQLKVKAFINELPKDVPFKFNLKNITNAKPVHIIGAGPAGLFAALKLIELGLKPIIIERGKDVKARRRDLALINKQGIVNPESNYCFGEGGAGTYSDGKLYTRSNKRGDVSEILNLFVHFGATPDILVDARPHIGTNKLPQIITNIRNCILECGGEIHFDTKLIDFTINSGAIKQLHTNKGVMDTKSVILATGHSAKDIFYLLHQKDILIHPKPFALGVRVEHPQYIIDGSQYHCEIRSTYLPPANYSLVEQVQGRGVFSFCMCPGGIIAPCSTNPNEIVVNGWSPSKRNNPFANSGMVVQVELEDIKEDARSPFVALEFQSKIEQLAFKAGGGNLVAPAQRLVDFVEGKISTDLPKTSYNPGVNSVNLGEIIPNFITERLKIALPFFGKKIPSKFGNKGYYTNEAVLVGVESRTSSPIRVPRTTSFNHPQIVNLYPCAEGSGYAGGIVSAAIDGMKSAEAIFNTY